MGTVRYLMLSICFVGLLVRTADACLWDTDTLEQERSRFPSVLELVTGKFLRHTPEFYEWRIRDRLRRLKEQPNKAWLADDLAVAYDKTEQHDQAIAVMLDVEKKTPGRYETAANLGTFYIHSGRLEEGLKQIERAIKINPHAHFGREIYQKLLVEYQLECRKGGQLPVPLSMAPAEKGARGFALYVWRRKYREKSWPGSMNFETTKNFNAEMDRALTGVLGMMRFGHHDSPLLLEALGDLLSAGEAEQDANWLAARTYLKASEGVKTETARTAFRTLAIDCLQSQSPGTAAQDKLNSVEQQLKQELKDADTWYGQVRDDELTWIEQGKNLDIQFAQKYYTEPQVVQERKSPRPSLVEPFSSSVDLSGSPVQTFSRSFWENLTNTQEALCGWLLLGMFVLASLRIRRRVARDVEKTSL
jgi:tetratricopeptide (TPR) repeat protein